MRNWCIVACVIWIIVGIMGSIPVSVCARESTIIETLQEFSGNELQLSVTVGEPWVHTFKAGLNKRTVTPQIAIWIEDLDGEFLETLYVTKKFAKQTWEGQFSPGKTHRMESLPYWMHKREAQSLALPTKKSPLPDAVTAASPTQDFVLHTQAVTEMTNVVVLMELNLGNDQNEAHPVTMKYGEPGFGKISGQPAVVYSVQVDLTQPGQYDMSIIGHSHPFGEDGTLNEDVSTLTTALQIIEKAVITIK